MDCTTTGWSPPIQTVLASSFPVLFCKKIGLLLRRTRNISALPQTWLHHSLTGHDASDVVKGDEHDEGHQRCEAGDVNHRLLFRVDRASANELRDDERRTAPVERRNRQEVKEPQCKRNR